MGKVCRSMKPPVVPTNVGATSVPPPGLRIDTLVLQQVDVPMVTLVIFRLILCDAVPLKIRAAFCPITVVVTVTAAPPGVIDALTSEALLSVKLMLPVLVLSGSMRIVYVPVAGSSGVSIKPPLVLAVMEASVEPFGL